MPPAPSRPSFVLGDAIAQYIVLGTIAAIVVALWP